MKTQPREKCLALILVFSVLATPNTGYGQVPTLVASTSSPLTETILDGGQVALLLSNGSYARSTSDIRNAVRVSGIPGVTVDRIVRLGNTAVTLVLDFSGHMGSDGTLTFTVGAQALANYNGPALTAELPVTAASAVSLTASTPYGLWESTLNGSVVTLTLRGRFYERTDLRNFVAVSGITGVTVDNEFGIKRASDTELTVELTYLDDFVAPMATDGTLTFTVHAQAIADYNGPALTVEVPVTAGIGPFSHDPARDLTLDAENKAPGAIWSDGKTLWVADFFEDKLFAYDLSTRARDPARDFTLDAENRAPGGIWSDGITMWVVEAADRQKKIFAYDMTTRARDPSEDFNTLDDDNEVPRGLWSDGATMWVADGWGIAKLYAYDLTTKARVPAKDIETSYDHDHWWVTGIWSDGITMWITYHDPYDDTPEVALYAYDMTTKWTIKARDPAKDFNSLRAAGNDAPSFIGSDGTTLWVVDYLDAKLYAYLLPSSPPKPANPDLTVRPAAVSNSSPPAGASFTLSTTVLNKGTAQSPGTTLRFYRSTDETISLSDTEVGSQPVSGLAVAASSDHFIDLTAPSGFGGFYYGACVESVGEEHVTLNNCSRAVAVVFGRDPARDFNTLKAAGNNVPSGLWSDGTTMWVADWDDTIYAYNLSTKARDPGKDFNALVGRWSSGLWSDGITMWVADSYYEYVYAYHMVTKTRDFKRNFATETFNSDSGGLWSDGTTLWVADGEGDSHDGEIYAYNLSTRTPDRSKKFETLEAAGNNLPSGLWSDGTTMWVADYDDGKIYAYDMTTKARDPGKDFNALEAAGNDRPSGLWSDGTTMWVADIGDGKIYAYDMDVATFGNEPQDTPAPNLVVDAPTVTNSSPAAGASFTLRATVRNQGAARSGSTTLRYYRSTDGTISTRDTEVGTDPVSSLSASRTSAESISLTAPSSAGTYYYGACVASVSGETDTGNNCSPAVAVTVAAIATGTGDFNGDGTVDFADFFEFVDAFGGTDARFDLNGDGTVDFSDFFEFVDAFGQSGQAKLLAMARDMIGLPSETELQQNAPNPFNNETVISWFLLEPGPARLEVFALNGQRVAVLRQGPQQAGFHRIHWDGRDDMGRSLASGVYLYRLVSAETVLTRKLTLLR